MKTRTKFILTVVAVLLMLSGGLDFGLTTVPGVALLLSIWGIPFLKFLA